MPAEVTNPVEGNNPNNEDDAPSSSGKRIVGIIYPPPEVRNIVDKTASFVARNGPEFETRIRQNEINNSKFNFLNPNDPYHAYYRHKVKEFQDGTATEPTASTLPKLMQLTAKLPSQVQVEPAVPKEPPPEYEFVADPPSISAYDLDVVKLTAQFVARNGRQFLTNLMNREQRNFQFDFLRPQHSLFHYFTKLVEQYTKVLIPPKDLMNKLKCDSENPKHILDQGKHRVEWTKYEERQRKKQEEQKERERVAYSQIEWHDFVVVETVDFQPNEPGNFPPPTTPQQVGARLLAEERFEIYGQDDQPEMVEMEVESDDDDSDEEEKADKSKAVQPPPPPPPPPLTDEDTELQDMDEGSSDEDEKGPSMAPPPAPPASDRPHQPPLPPMPNDSSVEIRRDYDPKAPKAPQMSDDKYLISPITGEKIPTDKMQEHMRIGLLDPRWLEQRDRMMHEKASQEEVFAAGSAIDSSLKQLAERRTDIFGEGDVETAIGKKIGEEDIKPKEKVAWDGHTASMEATINKAKANISIKEQIEAIHKAKGLTPDEAKEKIGPAKPAPMLPSMLGGHLRPPKPSMQHKPPTTHHHPPPAPPPLPPPRLPSLISAPGVPPPLGLPPRQNMQPMPPMRPPQFFPPGHQPPPGPPQHMQFMGGINPNPPVARPPGHPEMQSMPSQQLHMPPQREQQMMQEEPPAKKQKTEDTLLPENLFLVKNPGPVMFKVQVPHLPDKPEWKLNGQALTMTLPITDQISVIKAKLFEELGMPTGKQKLQLEGMFIKDSNTLAFYNVSRNSLVKLLLKDRGGRKR
ncbi:splicing factor 3A subunit 1-like [Saccoglossus kowalevskii]|uniref:Splicing factor 3A subunit 1-like n=1 Tax=Saccoglossus kowalevskii TaxID=10224 RepID=A0ABM0GWT2_SACKO|nr:PREDICTED: splicing factor 3A subunit 1-like [Saccoglossus kowalevskii]